MSRAIFVCKMSITFYLQNKNILYGAIEVKKKKIDIQIPEGKPIMFLQRASTDSTDLSLQCIWSHIHKILQEKLVLFTFYFLVPCRLSLTAGDNT